MAGALTRARVVIVMNPRSGGGKTARYGLVQRAEGMGAQVWTTSAEEDAASLARNAVSEGAQVLGVAGGDGTVFRRSPRWPPTRAGRWPWSRRAPATTSPGTWASICAIPGGRWTPWSTVSPRRWTWGVLGSRVFVNNVSFGVYTDALLEPGYREDKPRAFAAVAPDYAVGRGPRGHTMGDRHLVCSRITLHGEVRHLDAGVDGEAVRLPLPVVCGIRPGALRLLLPKDRTGMPPERAIRH